MYIKSLIITNKNGEIIRNIDFKIGLNIILGKSVDGKTTNSLGKTTVIRCINFCLGGKFDEFYKDSENKSVENKVIKDFLIINQIEFKLLLVRDFNKNSINDLTIIRKVEFDPKSNKPIFFNMVNKIEFQNDKSFTAYLKEKIFLNDEDKPSFRELIPKFIRRNDHEINRILYYLGDRTSDNIYSTIYFLLLGFNNASAISARQLLAKQLDKTVKSLQSLKSLVTDGLKQRIDILQAEIDQKTIERDAFQIAENYKADEDELLKIKIELSNFDKKLYELNFSKIQLNERLQSINSNKFQDDTKNIEYIYQEAKLLNTDLQNKFEATVEFHNNMLTKERDYLLKRLEKLDKQIDVLTPTREKLAENYNLTLSKIGASGALAEYQKLNEFIEKKSSELAHEKALDIEMERLRNTKTDLEAKLSNIQKDLEKDIQEFQKSNINIFNSYFSNSSEMLYNEKWYLAFDEETYKFSIRAFDTNVGSGKKQSLVAAFDIAYMAFLQDQQIQLPYPRFATQDKIEVIDISSLDTLAQLVLTANGQLIFPIIEDKFENFQTELIEKDVILTLTEEDRFFKI